MVNNEVKLNGIPLPDDWKEAIQSVIRDALVDAIKYKRIVWGKALNESADRTLTILESVALHLGPGPETIVMDAKDDFCPYCNNTTDACTCDREVIKRRVRFNTLEEAACKLEQKSKTNAISPYSTTKECLLEAAQIIRKMDKKS